MFSIMAVISTMPFFVIMLVSPNSQVTIAAGNVNGLVWNHSELEKLFSF
jgi:hypothetical protein